MVEAQAITSIRSRWQNLSPVRQFLAFGSTVLILGMAIIGFWVGHKIEEGVTKNTASATALYLDSFVAPLVQELADDSALSAKTATALDAKFSNAEFRRRILSVKIWTSDGHIIYATSKNLIGKKFEPSVALKAAWSGIISTELDDVSDDEATQERAAGIALLEVYSPIRHSQSGKTIAVMEFYASAAELQRDVYKSWVIVGLITLGMIGVLFGIVQRGSSTIEEQRLASQNQVQTLSELLRQNTTLGQRIKESTERAAGSNERFLRGISAELHDGPAQHLSLSLLRLDSLKPHIRTHSKQDTNPLDSLEVIRSSIAEALQEIRSLSAGLALPQLESKNLQESIETAIRSHERRTETKVVSVVGELPENVKLTIKICLYRFIQEALNNAFRHADSAGQSVRALVDAGAILVQVSDQGPGIQTSDYGAEPRGLGLSGIKERVEILNGDFKISALPNGGTLLEARINIDTPGIVDDEQHQNWHCR